MSSILANELDELFDEAVRAAGVFDVHEHLFSFDQRAARAPDLFGWIDSSYLSADLVSTGMERGMLGRTDLSPESKWHALHSLLPAVRHTGYMQVCRYAWQDLCGMNDAQLDDHNWRDIDAAIRAHNNSQSFKQEVLVDQCGMKNILVDYEVGGTANYFFYQREAPDWYEYLLRVRPRLSNSSIAAFTIVREMDLTYQQRVEKFDSLLYGWLEQVNDENIQLLGAETGRARTLDHYAAVIESAVYRCAESGMVGLKSALNCCRRPQFGPIDHKLAQEALRLLPSSLTSAQIIAFENFAFQQVVLQAGLRGLPIQIHTGTTFGSSGLASAHAGSAYRFADLIQQNPDTTFILMHANWPNWGEIEQLAKRYPNVALDLSWSIMLGPAEGRRMLQSLLTCVPLSKLLWGGDCCYVEESYGAYRQFRHILSLACADLIDMGMLSISDAVQAAEWIICKNAVPPYRSICSGMSISQRGHMKNLGVPAQAELDRVGAS